MVRADSECENNYPICGSRISADFPGATRAVAGDTQTDISWKSNSGSLKVKKENGHGT